MYDTDTWKCDNTISYDDTSLLAPLLSPLSSSSSSWSAPVCPLPHFRLFHFRACKSHRFWSSHQLRRGETKTLCLGLFTFIRSALQKMLPLSNFSRDRVVSECDSSLLSRSSLFPNQVVCTGGDRADVPHYCRWAVVCKLNCKAHSLLHHSAHIKTRGSDSPIVIYYLAPLRIWSPARAVVMIMQIRPVASSRSSKLRRFYCFGIFIFSPLLQV